MSACFMFLSYLAEPEIQSSRSHKQVRRLGAHIHSETWIWDKAVDNSLTLIISQSVLPTEKKWKSIRKIQTSQQING